MDPITGQTAVGRSVAIPGQIALMPAYTDNTGEIYKLFGNRKKSLVGQKVVRLKPDQPDRRLRPCQWMLDVFVLISFVAYRYVFTTDGKHSSVQLGTCLSELSSCLFVEYFMLNTQS